MTNVYDEYWSNRARNVGHRYAVTDLTEHDYRALYLDLFRQIAPAKVTRMLDYGCGPGLLLPIVRELWPEARYHGADISQEMIDYCETYRGLYAQFHKLPDYMQCYDHFDFLTCHSVFTHIQLPDAVALLKEFHRLLIPGGHASISIHDAPQDGNNFEGSIKRVDYNLRFFKGMLVQAGFSIEKVYQNSANNGQSYLGCVKI